MNTVFLGLGGNAGDRAANIAEAVKQLNLRAGTVTAVSRIYETEPWGMRSENSFLNVAVRLETPHTLPELMKILIQIESALGRVRDNERYTDRTMDIDVLLAGDLVMEDPVTVPHPRMHQRMFVLVPLDEIAGREVHPVLHTSVHALLQSCGDETPVRLWTG
jgi:2-amino-4-hydroxy-6-hydroxymethyldihydropteridine diphosphokinase